MSDLDAFVKDWCERAQSKTPEECARMAWAMMNDAWSRGYKQGKDDPEFDNNAAD